MQLARGPPHRHPNREVNSLSDPGGKRRYGYVCELLLCCTVSPLVYLTHWLCLFSSVPVMQGFDQSLCLVTVTMTASHMIRDRTTGVCVSTDSLRRDLVRHTFSAREQTLTVQTQTQQGSKISPAQIHNRGINYHIISNGH